jgi:membrane dipeptidase
MPEPALRVLACVLAWCTALACAAGPGDRDGDSRQARVLEARAARLHREAIVVDTHADTTPRFQGDDWDITQKHPKSDSHVDFPRMREGGLDAQFWSIYTGRAKEPGEAMKVALQRIDAVHRLVQRHPEETALATSAAELREVVASGRIASLMGVEGGHMIENDLAVLRAYHRLGVRYMTLTHSFHTAWADSSGTTQVPEPEHDGLTAFGEE